MSCCRAVVCASSSAPAVSLKTEFDILMAFGVDAIVSSDCVGCDSDELAGTLLELYIDCSVLLSHHGRFRKMLPSAA